jgi:myotubularin-related protein 5/13
MGSSAGPNLGQSIFDYIEKQNARSPLFYNFMHTLDTEHPVRFLLLLHNLC